MTTLRDMVDETLTTLHSYGLAQQSQTSLASALTDSGVVLNTATLPTGFGPGMAELEDEMVLITDASQLTTNALTVVRGYRSTAAAHAAGTVLTFNPPWPRVMVANALNDAIVAAYPTLYGVSDASFTSAAVANTYDLNTLDEKVMTVRTLATGPTLEWLPVTNYRFDSDLKKLTIYDLLIPNRQVKIITQRRLARIGLGDDLTVSGLKDSAKAYVILKACSMLTAMMDTAKLPNAAASPDTYTVYRYTGSASTVSQNLLRLAGMELAQERKRLQTTYPPTLSFSRRAGLYHR